jgi:hypothetical protein
MITNLTYPIALLLSTGKRTCESMGEIANLSGDTMLRLLDADVSLKEKCEVVNAFFKGKALDALIDDVLIEKMYAKFIEGLSIQYNSSSHTYSQSLCSVVIMLGDGHSYIPVTHKLWVNKEIIGADYRKKHEIAKDVLRSVLQYCKVRIVIADALYATVEFMQELNQLNVRFEMKIHANRIITLQSGEEVAIRNAFKNKLKGRRWRTILVIWKGLTLHITAYTRYNKHGECTVISQVSNYKATSSTHVRMYERRWNIEKFFRTSKQSLGLKDCQSRSLTRQTNHINQVFMAYTIVQMECRKYKLKPPEGALKRIKKLGFNSLHSYLAAPNQIFAATYT